MINNPVKYDTGAKGYEDFTIPDGPTAYLDFIGANTASTGSAYYLYTPPASGTSSAVNPGYGTFLAGTANGYTLPMTSYRVLYGGMEFVEAGLFWSSTMGDSSTSAYVMEVSRNRAQLNSISTENGYAVRCEQ